MSRPWIDLTPAAGSTRRLLSIVTSLVLAGFVAACGSTAVTTTSPTPVKCSVTLSPVTTPVAATGGGGDVALSTTPECTWTAAADAAWVARVEPASGQGSGTLHFEVAGNPSGLARQTQLVVNGVTVRVEQEGAPCRTSLSVTEQTVPSSGDTVRVQVSAPDGCAWTATTSTPWLTISAGANGSGAGAVQLTVQPNSGDARLGVVAIAGQTFSIEQEAPPAPVAPGCSYALNPSAQSVPAIGGPGSVAVASGCAWSPISNASWITITSAGGAGAGTLTFVVGPNTGGSRTGTITVGSATLTITQAAAPAPTCAFTLSSSTATAPAGGASNLSISVTAPAGCSWSTTSAAPWITLVSPPTSSGSGAVTFNVAANAGAARNGTLTVAGQTVTVSQAGSCAITVTPTTASVGAGAGNGPPISVTAPGGCGWTAVSNASWISVTSGASGTGAGSVAFSVTANAGAVRNGTLTVAGQTITVTQATGCSFTVSPTDAAVPAAGGAGPTISVTAVAGCSWTATTGTSWLAVTSGASGSGNGTVTFSASPNGGAARSGSLTVAGQSVTVTQSADCLFTATLTPTSFNADGGTAAGTVVTAVGCSWTATSDASWITVTSGASGSGSGAATFRIAANNGNARSGTVTLAGRTFTINQSKK